MADGFLVALQLPPDWPAVPEGGLEVVLASRKPLLPIFLTAPDPGGEIAVKIRPK